MANNFKTWKDGPNFDSKLPQNVTAIHGKSTQLVCRVIDLGNKTVRNTRKYKQRYSNKHNDTLRNIPSKCKAWILRENILIFGQSELEYKSKIQKLIKYSGPMLKK